MSLRLLVFMLVMIAGVTDMWIDVSRGAGDWGPPTRVGSPSEITLLRLVRA